MGQSNNKKVVKPLPDAVFDHKYVRFTMHAVNDDILELKLVEQEAPIMNWSGESATSFF